MRVCIDFESKFNCVIYSEKSHAFAQNSTKYSAYYCETCTMSMTFIYVGAKHCMGIYSEKS